MDEVLAIKQKIADLEKQSAELQKKNRPGVIADMREKMLAYNIKVAELTSSAPKATKPLKDSKVKAAKPEGDKTVGVAKAKKAVTRVPVKYKGHEEGQTWTGRGLPPKWLRVLEEGGKKREDFLVTEAPVTKTGEAIQANDSTKPETVSEAT